MQLPDPFPAQAPRPPDLSQVLRLRALPSLLEKFPEEMREIEPTIAELLSNLPWQIKQVKGAGDRKPPERAIPFIQDYVKSTGYEIIGDLHNTDLVDMKELSGNFIDGYMTKDEAREAVRKLFEERYPDQSPYSWYEAINRSY